MELEAELGITATQSLLPYTVALVFYALLMLIAGFYIPRLGMRPIAAIGGIIVGLGYILSSFVSDIGMMILSYGVLVGTGVGISYGVPMAWICYAIASLVGLSAIGISSSVGEEVIQINPALAASSVSLFALFNGLSRPLFGWLCDRIKPHIFQSQ